MRRENEEAGMPMRPPSVDDYGDDYGLRKDAAQSSTVVVAVVVHRKRLKEGKKGT
jgi:hypothetical protein